MKFNLWFPNHRGFVLVVKEFPTSTLFAIGTVSAFKRDTGNALAGLSPITYNPFLNSTFAFITNQQPITTATKVILQHGKAYATP